MRVPAILALALLSVCFGALPGAAAERGGEPVLKPLTPPRQDTLDDLFRRLAAAKDSDEARGIAGLIERRWARSGSDTADLLMARAAVASESKEYALAVELLDRVTVLQPNWAEAWTRRAAAFSRLEDPVRAVDDIRQAIAREPRHYGAWVALGQVYLSAEDNRRALGAFRRALAIHPFLDSVRTVVDRLAPEVEGREL